MNNIIIGKTIVLVPYTSNQLIGKVIDFKEGKYVVQFKNKFNQLVTRNYAPSTLVVLSLKGLKQHKNRNGLVVNID